MKRAAAAFALAVAAAILPTTYAASAARAGTPFSFAVIGDLPYAPAEEDAARTLIAAIGAAPGVAFVVHLGNLKGADEPCRDALLDARRDLLDTSALPLIYVPGENDWVRCGWPAGARFDPGERLDFLRENVFGDPTSLGRNRYPLIRQSDVTRFRQYRENVRWAVGDVLFVALDVPGDNNHYSTGGGRNGEFDDRVIANRFWLQYAADYAKQRKLAALVVLVHGDPQFGAAAGERRHEPFAWLRPRHATRDGYLEFRKDMVRVARTFDGPVLLIHAAPRRRQAGFRLDQPLHDERNRLVGNLTRLEIWSAPPLNRWTRIAVTPARRPLFRVAEAAVPAGFTAAATSAASAASAPTPASASETPPMPTSIPDATDAAPQ